MGWRAYASCKVVFVTDELGFNENQLTTLLSLSSEQLLHERHLPVFDSAIIATPRAMQSHNYVVACLCTNYIIADSTCMGCCIPYIGNHSRKKSFANELLWHSSRESIRDSANPRKLNCPYIDRETFTKENFHKFIKQSQRT